MGSISFASFLRDNVTDKDDKDKNEYDLSSEENVRVIAMQVIYLPDSNKNEDYNGWDDKDNEDFCEGFIDGFVNKWKEIYNIKKDTNSAKSVSKGDNNGEVTKNDIETEKSKKDWNEST